MTDEIEDILEQAASEPASASGDGTTVQQHSLDQLIRADKYLSGKRAAHADPRKAFARMKIVPPGTV
ncbi:MAG TPA: hypothetical protein PK082_00680 [Phycisphaerae bacterium]|nr:hypothetical protein [Phycisphaerae bacterium]